MGEGRFVEAAAAFGMHSLRDGRGLAVSDFDGDGDLDLVINNYKGPAHYFVNEHAARGHWLRVRLRGRESNRDGIGALLRVVTGERRQMRVVTAGDGYASQFSRVAHFGLGEAERVDRLEITWPSGISQVLEGIAVDQLLDVEEPERTRVAGGGR